MKIWAVANQKGGVGKTTTAVTLAGLLAEQGSATLLVDLDPHGSLTAYFGYDPDRLESSVYTLFQNDGRPDTAIAAGLIRDTRCAGLALLPASTALATLDRQSGARDGMGLVVARTLAGLGTRFDRVLIDCPPMLGVLMVNALAACDRLLIPVQTEFLALKGLERMLHTLEMIGRARRVTPPYSIVPTLYDRRTRAANDSLQSLRRRYPEQLWDAAIPVDTQFREASRAGQPLSALQPQARGVIAYRGLLDYLLALERAPHRVASV